MADGTALFSALANQDILDLFLDGLDVRDLSNLMPVIAHVDRNLYKFAFRRILHKRFYIPETVDKLRSPGVMIPDNFNKIYSRISPGSAITNNLRRRSWSDIGIFSLIDRQCVSYHDGIPGSIIYAHRTGWIILRAEETPEVEEKLIVNALGRGFNIAIDPNSTIIQTPEDDLKEYVLSTRPCHMDESLTSFFRVPKLIVYKGCSRARIVLYLHSSVPSEIHCAVDAINKRIFASSIDINYLGSVTMCLPCSKHCEFLPYLFYGNDGILSLPESIRYPVRANPDVYKLGKPLFREYPRV